MALWVANLYLDVLEDHGDDVLPLIFGGMGPQDSTAHRLTMVVISTQTLAGNMGLVWWITQLDYACYLDTN